MALKCSTLFDKRLTSRISIWFMDAFEGGKGERGVFTCISLDHGCFTKKKANNEGKAYPFGCLIL